MVDKHGSKNPNWRGGKIDFSCIECGKISNYRRCEVKKYCTHECYLAFRKKNISRAKCDICAKEFQRPKAHLARYDKNLCSVACRTKSQEAERNCMYKGGDVTKECLVCKKIFVAPRQGDRTKKTCSKKCFSIIISKTHSKPKKIKNCEDCEKSMELPKNSKRRFCSMACKNNGHSKLITGIGNGRYVHGAANAPYPLDWNNSCKKIVRQRDNHTCQLCGVGQTTKNHDVHHINYIKEDLSLVNLITLCRKCHGGCHGNLASRGKWKERLSNLLKK